MNTMMHTYKWTCINRYGKKSTGIIDAESIEAARALLHRQDLIIRRLIKKRKKPIKQAQIIIFSRELSILIKAGLTLIQALDMLRNEQKNPHLLSMITSIKQDIEKGQTFTESLRRHSAFSHLFCNLIEVGEAAGVLNTMLDKVTSYFENIACLKMKIKKALIYPAVILSISILMTISLLIFIVPQFEFLFLSLDSKLPSLTLSIIHLSQFIQYHWIGLVIIMASVSNLFIYLYPRSKLIIQTIEKFTLKTPIVGPIICKGIMARITRTLSIICAAGLPLLDALKSVESITGSITYEHAIHEISTDVSNGHRLYVAIQKTTLFPNFVTQMIAIGEESGTLEHMLTKIADLYEGEIESEIDILTRLMEPLLMVILGLLVGGLMLAMYLPILHMGTNL